MQGNKTLDRAESNQSDLPVKRVSLSDFVRERAARGMRSHPGENGTWWLHYETGVLMRFPIFATSRPTSKELHELHWKGFAPLVSYLVEPEQDAPANSVVYLCTNRQYNLAELDHGTQGNVRRGLNECEIRRTELAEVLEGGARAFIDTWRRHGWTNVSSAHFQKHLCSPTTLCGNRYFGVWRDRELVAFAGLIEADDWVEVRVRYSTDASLRFRPNDALLYHILLHYLTERGFQTVSAGASSIDPSANPPGLHRFKVKMGFQAVSVQRVMSFHPLLRPIVSCLQLLPAMSAFGLIARSRKLRLALSILQHRGNPRLGAMDHKGVSSPVPSPQAEIAVQSHKIRQPS